MKESPITNSGLWIFSVWNRFSSSLTPVLAPTNDMEQEYSFSIEYQSDSASEESEHEEGSEKMNLVNES